MHLCFHGVFGILGDEEFVYWPLCATVFAVLSRP